MVRVTSAALLLTALAGCSNPLATGKYLIDPPAGGGQVANRLGSAELMDVTLPDYAQADEVPFQDKDGAVRSTPKQLWADTPVRAFTVALARVISDASGATVIPEPWPLDEPPARKLRVDVEQALAGRDGIYRLTGRYYVSGSTNHARSFAIAVPLPAEGPGGIAAAQSSALAQLARQIATLSGPGTSIATSAPAPQPLDMFDLPPLILDEPSS